MRKRFFVPGGRCVLASFSNIKGLRQALCLSLLGIGLMAGSVPAEERSLTDRLEVPARFSKKAGEGLLTALSLAGQRVIAAGQRGHILWSDDSGHSWHQAQVPVSSDLTALQFVGERLGWAVGHDGVILHTQDAGATWQLQLDGHRIAELLRAQAARMDRDLNPRAVLDLEQAAAQGLNQSLLALHFLDANHGYALGAGGLLLRTRDGGQNWQSVSDQIENPRGLHLYGMQQAFGRLFIVGEQGLILRQALNGEAFEKVQSPYQGSWFGALGGADSLLVYGLMGNAWITRDSGASWQQSQLSSALALTSASTANGQDLVMVSLGGEVFRSADEGRHFQSQDIEQRYPFFAVAATANADLVLADMHGVRSVTGKSGVQP